MKSFTAAVLLLSLASPVLASTLTPLSTLSVDAESWEPMNMVESPNGSFYGVTRIISSSEPVSYAVFRLNKNGTHTKVHSLGSSPVARRSSFDLRHTLTVGSDGAVYGISTDGGSNGGGFLYRVNTDDTFEVLKNFDPICNSTCVPTHQGATPYYLWSEGAAIYGATQNGGAYKTGSLFKYASNTFSISGHFAKAEINSTPGKPKILYTGYLLNNVGTNFYTYMPQTFTYSLNNLDGGTLNKVSIQGGAGYTVTPLHTFSARTSSSMEGNGFTNLDGTQILWAHQTSTGDLYGETAYEGTSGQGTLFKIKDGLFSVIHQKTNDDWRLGKATGISAPIQETPEGTLLLGGIYSMIELSSTGVSIKETACPECFVVKGSDSKGYGFARSYQWLIKGVPDQAYTYKWSGAGTFYTLNLQNTITPPNIAPIVVSLNASPSSVTEGSDITIVWSSTNAESCEASGSWSGPKPTSGTYTTVANAGINIYALTCSSATETSASSVTMETPGVADPVDPSDVTEPPQSTDTAPLAQSSSSGGAFSFFLPLLLLMLLFSDKTKSA